MNNLSQKRQTYKIDRIEQLRDTIIEELNEINKDIFNKCDIYIQLDGKLSGNDISIKIKVKSPDIQRGNRINEFGNYFRGNLAHIIKHIKPEEINELLIRFNVILSIKGSSPPIVFECEAICSIKLKSSLQ